MTEVGVVYLAFYYGSYNIYYTAWADYVNGSVSGIAFLNFESTRVWYCHCVLSLPFDCKGMSLSMLI